MWVPSSYAMTSCIVACRSSRRNVVSELRLWQSVGVSDLPRETDEDAVGAALQKAGAAEIAQRLPDGVQTQLGAQWPGGVDLSHGQWQRIALARGFIARGGSAKSKDSASARRPPTTSSPRSTAVTHPPWLTSQHPPCVASTDSSSCTTQDRRQVQRIRHRILLH
jgi:hypothetical protein